jgi:RNA polymerase sigma-70 factor (ECF subfamily)
LAVVESSSVTQIQSAVPPSSVAAADRELGRALIARHPDAPRAAWDRYSPMVRGILKRALGPGGDVEDLVHDVFLCLLRSAHALRNADAVRPFVIGITRHTLHRELKQKRRRRQLASEYRFQPADMRQVGGGPAASYLIIKMQRMLRRLTEQERSSLLLRFGHGMTMNEVAKALRTSEPTAKRRVSSAQARLYDWADNDQFLLSYLEGRQTSLTTGMEC